MSLWITTKRIARYGFVGFFRNGFISLAAVLILSITLFVIATLMVASAALTNTLEELSNSVDVNVYFVIGAPEQQVLEVKESLETLPEVASVEYTTPEQALEEFRQRHQNDQLTLQALEELAENPLGASLSVRAKDTGHYESIATFLETVPAAGNGSAGIIEKVNFQQNRGAIERLTNIIDTSRTLGLAIVVLFGIASTLIAFNTIRLAIYTSREEIGVMRLVGAGPWYVRGPFVVAGVLYGFLSGIVVLVLMYPITLWLGGPSEAFFGSFNTFNYFIGSFPIIFLTIMGTGILLGALSSYLAVRRYLRN